MSKTFRRVMLLMLIITFSIMFVIFYRNIIIVKENVIYDNLYDYKKDCSNARCVTILYMTRSSFNSEIEKYFFIGDMMYIPKIDKDYVYFRDAAEFCFRRIDGGNYEIYSDIPASENNLEGRVKVLPLGSPGKNCTSGMF